MSAGSKRGNVPLAYGFWIATLLFGFPLLSSFYAIQDAPEAFFDVVVPYIVICALVGLLIMRFGPNTFLAHEGSDPLIFNSSKVGDESPKQKRNYSNYAAIMALVLGTLAVVFFGLMKQSVAGSYPYPNSGADVFGEIYMLALMGAVAVGFPLVLLGFFPAYRKAVGSGVDYKVIAAVTGVVYLVIYLLLVNQIVITGFNTPPDNVVGSPTGTYPFSAVFTSGPPPAASAESAVYVPFILVQLNLYFNVIIQPFEILFAIVLGNLIAASIVTARYLMSRGEGHSCMTGATFSGIGGVVGLTATCPSCLAPTLITVMFGGFSAASSVIPFYSNLAAAILPPLVSIAALLVSLVLLEFKAKGGEFSRILDSIFDGRGSKIQI